MSTRKTSLLLASTSAAALSMFAFAGVVSTSASAQTCVGVGVGGGGVGAGDEGWEGGPLNDLITCTGPQAKGTTPSQVDGNEGDDTISIDNSFHDFIAGGEGSDTITVDGGGTNVGGNLTGDNDGGPNGGDGDDVITITGGASVLNVRGDSDAFGSGSDTISLVDGTVRGAILGDGGADSISITGGTVQFDVSGGLGDDKITLDGGTIQGNLNGNSGNDVITVNGGVAETDISGGNDNDSITLNGGVVEDDIFGNDGNDVIALNGGTIGNDPNENSVFGGNDDDTITLDGTFIQNDIIGGDGDDSITLTSGRVEDVFGSSGDDTIIADGADIIEDIGAGTGSDLIIVNADEFLDVDAGNDDDTIEMNGGDVDNLIGGDGDDSITMNGGQIDEDLEGNNDDDTIVMTGGIVGDGGLDDDILAGNGNDSVLMTGGEVTGDIEGSFGEDTIVVMGGTVGDEVRGGFDNDMITLNGGLVVDDIEGDDGDDVIDLLAGAVGNGTTGSNVQGDDGDDTITLDGAFVEDDILGGNDNDSINLLSGTIGIDGSDEVRGNDGDDDITLVRAFVFDDILGDAGNDIVSLFGGTIGGNALGGSGDDIGIVGIDGTPFDFDNLGGGTGVFAGDDNTGTDDGDDSLIFIGWFGEVNADRLPEWNEVDLVGFTGATFTGGTLETDGPSDIEVFIDATSTLFLTNNVAGGGNTTIAGNLTNDGSVNLSAADSDPDNVLTVTGNYAAASDLVIDTFLNDGVIDITDQLLIDGNATGQTDLTVNPVPGSPGGLTGDGPTDGILVVGVGGVSDDDAFSLTNADLVAGIFKYELVNPEGQPFGRDDWYLQSDWLDQIYVYETLPGAMQAIGLALTGQLVERVGVRSAVQSPLLDANGVPVEGGAPVDTAVWARAVGLSLDSEGDLESTTGGNFNQTIGFVQGGAEVVVSRSDAGRFLIGALGHWGTSTVDVNDADNVERGSANFDYYGGGLTATWYGTSGLYLDVVGQYTAYDIDVSTTSRFSSVTTDGWGVSVSGEAGYRIPISETAAIVPQAQVIWQTFEFDDFTDPDGVRVSYQDDDSLVGRLGVAFENSAAIGSSLVTGYLEANVLHEFLGDNTINTFTPVGGTIPISQDLGGTSVEVGFGGTVAVNRGVSLYAEVDYNIPFDNGLQGFQALGGIRVNLNPAPPPPMPVPEIIPVPETAFIVFFDWDRADLTPEANLVLDDVVVVANESGYASIRLDGYTDLSGSAAYNLGLSERRANSVADGLIARGIAPDEIVIRAFGEENPLVPTPDGVREPQNRRVEIFLS